MKQIAVYCASSNDIPAPMLQAGYDLGVELARNGCNVVCGGGRTGLMARVIDGNLTGGASPVGVIPSFMVEKGWQHPSLPQMIVTDGMHSRKARMLEMADGIIALPGGIGTLEELLEAITWRQLNLYHGRIVMLNTDGYFNPLLIQLEAALRLNFMLPEHRQLWQEARTVSKAVAMVTEPDNHPPFNQKIR